MNDDRTRPSSPPVKSRIVEDPRMEMEPETLPAGPPEGKSGQPGMRRPTVSEELAVEEDEPVADMADTTTPGINETRL